MIVARVPGPIAHEERTDPPPLFEEPNEVRPSLRPRTSRPPSRAPAIPPEKLVIVVGSFAVLGLPLGWIAWMFLSALMSA